MIHSLFVAQYQSKRRNFAQFSNIEFIDRIKDFFFFYKIFAHFFCIQFENHICFEASFKSVYFLLVYVPTEVFAFALDARPIRAVILIELVLTYRIRKRKQHFRSV